MKLKVQCLRFQAFVFVVLVSLLLVSCSSDLVIDIDTENKLSFFDFTSGRTDSVFIINENLKGYKIATPKQMESIQQWFTENQDGWYSTPVSFLPNIQFNVNQYNFNLWEKSIVVNFIDRNGEPRQWSHSLNDSTFNFVFIRE